ncbi:ABC transporter substrate-binding protein [Bradyrhizobium sp. NP1]|uniref:ABC transporter substrate-binding protein n=1 Tax=Bradyrhizobium sp. NP1 TaxID=3049772 RepID=UPI0025A62C0D|nr:ABC transporter substrate-binding protein [Bradyrhizobium sp. NP1]WJR81191.1 ABC transporter substrate-binding protein [Bradyrhizobium sp. NP1]
MASTLDDWMRRREFILSVGSVAVVLTSAAHSQQSEKLPIVGFLVAGTQASHGAWVAAFAQRLSELGWTDGRNIKIEYRWAAGDVRQTTEFAAELVHQKVDVIVTSAYGVVAAKQATSTIPIVFAAYGDAVANGIVGSLARPGGNVTGLSIQPSELSSKRLELLREIIPNVGRVAALVNTNYSGVTQEMIGIRTASAKLNLEASILEVQTADGIEAAMAAVSGQTDALYVWSEPLTNANKSKIIKAATAAKIPTIFGFREFVDAGGLISYGPNFIDLFRRAAEFTDKILRGATPADMPIQQPVKFDLIINLKAAKALGLSISETILTRADEVIE